MRLWHYKLLPYLPDRQLRGQLRELVAIMRDWRDKGKTNHVLINGVMCYDKSELERYFCEYARACQIRFGSGPDSAYSREFEAFAADSARSTLPLFYGWHDVPYLRMCMANLCEKHLYGRGISRLTKEEWARLTEGYRTITGEEYCL